MAGPVKPREFVSGLVPHLVAKAKTAILQTAVWCKAVSFGDDRPLPAAFSLSKFRLWPFDQGPVGTCWANATTQTFQIQTAASGRYEPVPLSRCTTCYQGKILDGGGNPADGGSVTNGLLSMADAPHGIGSCHDEKWPYKADRRYLAQSPPAGALEDATLNRLHAVAESPMAEWKRAIFNGHPVAIGIWWPNGWDTAVDKTGRATGIGSGRYGHALAVIGWIDDWDGHTWYELENSHGPIYHPLPIDVAAKVPGYQPSSETSTYDFWVRDDWMQIVIGYGNAEHVIAADLTGFRATVIDTGWSDFQ